MAKKEPELAVLYRAQKVIYSLWCGPHSNARRLVLPVPQKTLRVSGRKICPKSGSSDTAGLKPGLQASRSALCAPHPRGQGKG